MWFYELNGYRYGPNDAEQMKELLRSGEIDETTRVRRDGELDWHLLDETDLIWLVQEITEERELEDEEDDYEEEEEPDPLSPLEEMIAEGERIWYYLLNEKVYGPVTTDEIALMRAQGEINAQTQVSESDIEHWQALSDADLVNIQPNSMQDGED